jgi:hypothetical protein
MIAHCTSVGANRSATRKIAKTATSECVEKGNQSHFRYGLAERKFELRRIILPHSKTIERVLLCGRLTLLLAISCFAHGSTLVVDCSNQHAEPDAATATTNGLHQVKAAGKTSGPGTKITVAVNCPFTQAMADRAHIDTADPRLSADGASAGVSGGTAAASAECLLAETIVNAKNQFDDAGLDSFCKQAAEATTPEQFERVKRRLEEQGTLRIEDALIHVVKWTKGSAEGTWYQYERRSGKWRGVIWQPSAADAVSSPLDHLLGHGNVAFLAIHLGIDDSCEIAYDIQAKHTTPLNQQDVVELIKLAKDFYASGDKVPAASKVAFEGGGTATPTFIGVWGGSTLLALPRLPALITATPAVSKVAFLREGSRATDWQVTSTCTPEKSVPNHVRSIQISGDNALLRTVSARTPSATKPGRSTKKGTDDAAGDDNPAKKDDDKPAKKKDPLADMAASVSDEGLHWWDVSVALPVTSYKNLKYDSENNLVVPKKTDDIKPYALFDFYPRGADLQARSAISAFKFTAGIPISNKPLQKPFFGGGLGFAIKSFRFQPLVGIRVQRETRTNLAAGSSANQAQLDQSTHYEWHAKLQVMVGFSIKDARKALGLK